MTFFFQITNVGIVTDIDCNAKSSLLTVEHIFDGVDRRGRRGEGGRELLAEVVKPVEVVGEADALALRLGQQALSKLVGSFHPNCMPLK